MRTPTLAQCNPGESSRLGFCWGSCPDGYRQHFPTCVEKCKSGYDDIKAACVKTSWKFWEMITDSYVKDVKPLHKGSDIMLYDIDLREGEHGKWEPLCVDSGGACAQTNVDAALAQRRDVRAYRGVRPHLLVHRGRDRERRRAREADGGQEIVREAVGEPGDEVGRCRRDDDALRPARELDVAHRGFRALVPQRRAHRVAGERLQRGRADEVQCRIGHDHAHFGACVLQAARELGGLVRRDAAADAEQHAQARRGGGPSSGAARHPNADTTWGD